MVSDKQVLRLKVIARLYGLSSKDIAQGSGTGYHRNTISNVWAGKSSMPREKRHQVTDYLVSQGVPLDLAAKSFEVVREQHETVRLRKQMFNEEIKENPDRALLTLGVVMLRPCIRKHFGLSCNPFNILDRPFESRAFQLCREAVEVALEDRAFLAIAGRTGCGKSILWTAINRSLTGGDTVKTCSVRRFDKGKVRVRDIYLSLLEDLADEAPKGGNERVHRRVENLLIEHTERGVNVCILVNEAHDLSVESLIMLKRLWEAFNDAPRLGYRRAATVILLGQKPLDAILRQERPELREVSQRTEVESYGPLEPGEVELYLRHRFAAAGNGAFEKIFDPGAVEFMASRNIPLTPLVVNSTATNAMKVAFQVGARQVTAAHVGRLLPSG